LHVAHQIGHTMVCGVRNVLIVIIVASLLCVFLFVVTKFSMRVSDEGGGLRFGSETFQDVSFNYIRNNEMLCSVYKKYERLKPQQPGTLTPSTSNVPKCAQACEERTGCTGFYFEKSSNNCYTFSNHRVTLTTDSMQDTFIKSGLPSSGNVEFDYDACPGCYSVSASDIPKLLQCNFEFKSDATNLDECKRVARTSNHDYFATVISGTAQVSGFYCLTANSLPTDMFVSLPTDTQPCPMSHSDGMYRHLNIYKSVSNSGKTCDVRRSVAPAYVACGCIEYGSIAPLTESTGTSYDECGYNNKRWIGLSEGLNEGSSKCFASDTLDTNAILSYTSFPTDPTTTTLISQYDTSNFCVKKSDNKWYGKQGSIALYAKNVSDCSLITSSENKYILPSNLLSSKSPQNDVALIIQSHDGRDPVYFGYGRNIPSHIIPIGGNPQEEATNVILTNGVSKVDFRLFGSNLPAQVYIYKSTDWIDKTNVPYTRYGYHVFNKAVNNAFIEDNYYIGTRRIAKTSSNLVISKTNNETSEYFTSDPARTTKDSILHFIKEPTGSNLYKIRFASNLNHYIDWSYNLVDSNASNTIWSITPFTHQYKYCGCAQITQGSSQKILPPATARQSYFTCMSGQGNERYRGVTNASEDDGKVLCANGSNINSNAMIHSYSEDKTLGFNVSPWDYKIHCKNHGGNWQGYGGEGVAIYAKNAETCPTTLDRSSHILHISMLNKPVWIFQSAPPTATPTSKLSFGDGSPVFIYRMDSIKDLPNKHEYIYAYMIVNKRIVPSDGIPADTKAIMINSPNIVTFDETLTLENALRARIAFVLKNDDTTKFEYNINFMNHSRNPNLCLNYSNSLVDKSQPNINWTIQIAPISSTFCGCLEYDDIPLSDYSHSDTYMNRTSTPTFLPSLDSTLRTYQECADKGFVYMGLQNEASGKAVCFGSRTQSMSSISLPLANRFLPPTELEREGSTVFTSQFDGSTICRKNGSNWYGGRGSIALYTTLPSCPTYTNMNTYQKYQIPPEFLNRRVRIQNMAHSTAFFGFPPQDRLEPEFQYLRGFIRGPINPIPINEVFIIPYNEFRGSYYEMKYVYGIAQPDPYSYTDKIRIQTLIYRKEDSQPYLNLLNMNVKPSGGETNRAVVHDLVFGVNTSTSTSQRIIPQPTYGFFDKWKFVKHEGATSNVYKISPMVQGEGGSKYVDHEYQTRSDNPLSSNILWKIELV